MKIEWAPVKVPPQRRIQTLAIGVYVTILAATPLLSVLAVLLLLIYGSLLCQALLIIYLAYVYYDYTRRHSVFNNIGLKCLRKNAFAKHFRDYFPIELIKTAELRPNRNYIFASFPHGVIGTGVCCNMGFDIGRWSELFPGIRPKIATLDVHFRIPFLREILRMWGFISVSKESLMYYLTRSNDPKHRDNTDGFRANAVAILVGGAQEALDSHPGSYILTLKHRKGFVKVAIRTGSPIVPNFSFGEVDIFDQLDNPPDSLLRRFQSFTKKVTGISPVIVIGRGFFQYTFGFLPRRKHLVQVVGAPIEVKQNPNPDPAYVDEIHGKVMKALDELFEKYKRKYIENSENVKLVIN